MHCCASLCKKLNVTCSDLFRLVQTCFVRTGRVVTLTVSATKLNIPTTEGAFTWSVGENRSLDEFARFLCGRRAAPWALGARAASGLYAGRRHLRICYCATTHRCRRFSPLVQCNALQCKYMIGFFQEVSTSGLWCQGIPKKVLRTFDTSFHTYVLK